MNLSEPVTPHVVGQTVGKYRWTICALLFFATTVNYLDRQVLSLLAPDLSKEFGWSNTDYANIAAAFQFVYAVSMLFAGRVVDKIGTKAAYVVAIVIWSLGAILHAFSVPLGEGVAVLGAAFGVVLVPSIAGFMISRAVLAVGEAGNFPAAIKATAEYFPKKERSFATGIFNSGANVGAILAPITVPVIAAIWGWQSAFIMIGMLGFIWMSVWLWLYEKPEQQPRLSKAELAYIRSDSVQPVEKSEQASAAAAKKVSWFQLLKYRQTWAFAFGKFMTDGVWWFFLFWLPTYLSAQYGMKGDAIIVPLAVLYSMTMIGSIGGGWFPSYFMSRGYAPYDGRMKAMLVIAFFPLVVLLAQPLGAISFWVPVLLIGVGASAHQAWSANIFTTVSDMFPQKSVASVIGIGGMAGGIGGVALTKLGGWVFDYYKSVNDIRTGYMIMFAICALAYLVAWCVMKALVPRHKEITDL
ncbi:ACS family hexuronate transporter-like MFS transporter [Duganella sp. 1411]|jgi:ACS family hexuronate transporter-like MFS transporter|uniref:MFS transporter n=1 Tax=Duganella sp. 1411 TaxID=2806572 RepID=UPI001AE661F9|nr:MFS transporter [Duganella sp. 1411]MBP1206687.1 ACS family hexuronate transporter-like MFS transporter [Duganella sp. 1411]